MNGDLASPMTWAAGAGALAYLFVKVKARLELSKAKHPSLRGHARIVSPRGEAGAVLRLRRGSTSSAPTTRPPRSWRAAATASAAREAVPGSVRGDAAAHGARPRPASPICSSPPRTAFRSSIRRFVGQHLKSGSFYRSSSGVTLTDLDGNTLHDVTGSYGVNVLRNDFYKELHRARRRARARARAGAGQLPPRGGRQRRTLARDLRARRGVVPHVGDRGGDAGGAARALSHAAFAPGSVLRLLPRLVG